MNQEPTTTSIPVLNEVQNITDNRELHYFTSHSTCKSDKVHRGSTSIYIFEAVGKDENQSIDEEMMADEPNEKEYSSSDDCMKNFKRSTGSHDDLEDETVVIIRKRGNKVFIEI